MNPEQAEPGEGENSPFALVVRRRLDELGWPQVLLAERADVDADTVGDLIAGKRRPYKATRQALSVALGWPENALDLVRAGELPDYTRVAPDEPAVETGLPGRLAATRLRLGMSRGEVAGLLSSVLERPVSSADLKRWEHGVAEVPEDAFRELRGIYVVRAYEEKAGPLPLDEPDGIAAAEGAAGYDARISRLPPEAVQTIERVIELYETVHRPDRD